MNDRRTSHSRNILVVGASRGLGRALVEGVPEPGDLVIGVSRSSPAQLRLREGVTSTWIEADLGDPTCAARTVEAASPPTLDVVIYNAGIWEPTAFTDAYRFEDVPDEVIAQLVAVNITAAILVIRRLIPRLLASRQPRLLITGSTSALPGCGRPEVGFGASKSSLNGVASALRESYRSDRLAVSLLQLGYLDTETPLEDSREDAARRGGGKLIPVHDVVAVVRTLLDLSSASFVRELIMPALCDDRF